MLRITPVPPVLACPDADEAAPEEDTESGGGGVPRPGLWGVLARNMARRMQPDGGR